MKVLNILLIPVKSDCVLFMCVSFVAFWPKTIIVIMGVKNELPLSFGSVLKPLIYFSTHT